MKKRIYLLALVAAVSGLAACAPKADGTATKASIEASNEGTEEGQEESEQKNDEHSGDAMLDEVHEKVKQAYGERYIPSMPYDDVMMKEVFGIDPSWYETYIAEGPMISAHVETFIGVKAKDGKVKEVEQALEQYKKEQFESGLQYPMNLPKLEAAEVLTEDNYVFFVMLGGVDSEASDKGEEEALESAKQNNQIGIEVIRGLFED